MEKSGFNLAWLKSREALGGTVVKNQSANARDMEIDPWDEKIPWKRKWQPTPVSFLRKFNG